MSRYPSDKAGWLSKREHISKMIVSDFKTAEFREYIQRFNPRDFVLDGCVLHELMADEKNSNEDIIWVMLWIDRCTDHYRKWEYDFRGAEMHALYDQYLNNVYGEIDKHGDDVWKNAMKSGIGIKDGVGMI